MGKLVVRTCPLVPESRDYVRLRPIEDRPESVPEVAWIGKLSTLRPERRASDWLRWLPYVGTFGTGFGCGYGVGWLT